MTNAAAFFEQFSPVSRVLDFMRCDLDVLLEHFVGWRQEISANSGLPPETRPLEQGKLTYEQKMLLCLPIVSPGITRIVVSETQSDWICLWGNGRSGISGDTIKNYLGRTLGIERLNIKHTMLRDPGSSQFNYNGPGENGHNRSIAAHKESRWEFHQYGDPLPFEDAQTYSERLIKKRLPAALLDQYCRELGIRLVDNDFYFGRNVLLPMRGIPQTRVIAKRFTDPALALKAR